jgi:molybdopterin-guanine dinucleotide biosynthesis protein A
MGRDKALLELHGKPLIGHAIDSLRTLGFSPRIVGSRQDLSVFAAIIPDNFPGTGPLGGIEAALAASDTVLNLFLPVDLPFLPLEFLRWMVNRAERSTALATIPRIQGLPQPLCAVYSKALLPSLQAALMTGNFKVLDAVRSAQAVTGLRIDSFDVETIAAALGWEHPVPAHRWFDNLNTPAEVETALEQSTRIH